MAFLTNLFGGQINGNRESDNAAEVVENLIERVETSTVPEDRRDALKALRSLAKKVRLPVAAIGMNVYMEILEKEGNSSEIISIVLEILVAVLCDDETADEGQDEIGERLAEMIVRRKMFITSIMALVESYEFAVRRAVIQLLTALLRHRASEVQTAIVEEPMGVSRLVDLLHDTREIIRNSTVLMMSELSRAHPQIQQLLAYENAFQLLFDVIDVEPMESIVIEDCLYVILNLLRKNPKNQQLFREASLIQKLAVLLNSFLYGREGEEDLSQRDYEWQKQKIANVIFLLQVVRSLVSPQENSQNNTHAAQKAISQSGMLKNLCSVLLSEIGATVEVLTEAIITVAEVICGDYPNQEYFSTRSLATDVGNRPALIVLLLSMNTDKQPFKLRCAVFYCFLCYLYDNEFGKTKVIDTLLPSGTSSDTQITTGQCICTAILSSETVQVWLGCVCLLHCLLDADHLKQQLLRVQLTTNPSETPSSLLRHLSAVLISLGNRRPQTRAGLLMLLSTWLHNCPMAVTQFISVEENIQYLTTHIDGYGTEGSEDENQVVKGLIAFLLAICLVFDENNEDKDRKNALNVVVERRVGKEKLVELLEGLSHSEHYVKAAQRPQPLAKTAQDLLLDYHFTKFFKSVEGQMVKQICPSTEMSSSSINNDSVFNSYKELIKRQDETIASLNQQIKKLKEDLENQQNDEKEKELASLRKQLAEQCQTSGVSISGQREIEHYKCMAMQWQSEAKRYQKWAEQWQQYQVSQSSADLQSNPQYQIIEQLISQNKELEEQLEHGWQMYDSQGVSLAAALTEIEEAKAKIHALEEQISLTTVDHSCKQAASAKTTNDNEVAILKKEQEDLLVLLADQDAKILEYRRKLSELGQAVTDDEDTDA
uniref:General vesicular transport factor p115 n=1 Tax=Setaria digitata TaxID=48799 RepID=A0A915PK69_9BILA